MKTLQMMLKKTKKQFDQMKDELGGKVITEFVEFRLKTYS